MIKDEVVEQKLVSREVLAETYLFELRRDVFEYGDQQLQREYVVHAGAVGVIALDHQGNILLIKQYRVSQGKMMWEVPAGLLDVAGEDPLVAAQRELLEETGYEAKKWNVLVDFATTPGGSTEQIRMYLAQGLIEHPDGRPQAQDEENNMQVEWVSVSEVLESIGKGSVTNPVLVTGTLALIAALAEPETILRDENSAWLAREEILKSDRVRLPNPKQ